MENIVPFLVRAMTESDVAAVRQLETASFRIHGQKGSSWRRSSVPMMNPGSSLEAGERSAVI